MKSLQRHAAKLTILLILFAVSVAMYLLNKEQEQYEMTLKG